MRAEAEGGLGVEAVVAADLAVGADGQEDGPVLAAAAALPSPVHCQHGGLALAFALGCALGLEPMLVALAEAALIVGIAHYDQSKRKAM
jgi:hypothetical protein